MAQPVAYYPGADITVYPSSNAVDSGKRNIEFNVARLTTRVTSKNFCITKPAFVPSRVLDAISNRIMIEVSPGEMHINGYDIIVDKPIRILPPEAPAEHINLGFKLSRDSSNNVLGDTTYMGKTTMEGAYLSWFPDPISMPDDDKDRLIIGSAGWDGTDFIPGSIIEDPDKYGKIWASDIWMYWFDPKHPDETRMDLQTWLNHVPDWYFSKEGDVIYGAADFLPGRGPLKPRNNSATIWVWRSTFRNTYTSNRYESFRNYMACTIS